MIQGFTPIETRMLKLLSDGEPHSPTELHGCLDDELAPLSSIRFHLSNLRKKLRLSGCDILTQFVTRRLYYRLVVIYTGGSELLLKEPRREPASMADKSEV